MQEKLEKMPFPIPVTGGSSGYDPAFYQGFEDTLDGAKDAALYQLCMRRALADLTPNLPDRTLLTDAIVTPVLQGQDYETACPSILVGTDSKGNQKVVVTKTYNLDGGGF